MPRVVKPLVTCVCLVSLGGCAPPAGLTSAEAKQERLACQFKTGAAPFDSLGREVKLGESMPIDHVVIVMQENRSFDHYFSRLSHGGVRVAPQGVVNLDSKGVAHERAHQTHLCLEDPDHSWDGSHQQWNHGANDGFALTNEPHADQAMSWYDERELPYYYGLARTFALSDAHFASVMGPTRPNRLYLMAATSFGLTANDFPPREVNGKPVVTLFSRLKAAKVEWKVYSTNLASPALFVDLLSNEWSHFRDISEYFADAQAGTLPAVSLVESQYVDGIDEHVVTETDEHAHSNIQKGQAYTALVLSALMNGPAWPRSALFLTYDEHGGFYDSVPPPPACAPDEFTPKEHPDQAFDHYGFRVPLVVVSPYARRGYVSHEVSDHASIDRFIEARFGLPAMTARDANADALLDLFDFEHPNTQVPALPEAVIDAAAEAQCAADFP